jgi:hypothetical protein
MDILFDFLRQFETAQVFSWLQSLDLNELIHNRYFLGGTAALAVIALLMRWRLLLTTLLGVAGFVALLSYTLQRGTGLDEGLHTDTLLIFVAGGVALVGAVIYFLFIRTD